MNVAPEYFVFALKPDANLSNFIMHSKSKTRELVGDQTYLSHPPHLTLYVSAFDCETDVKENCQVFASNLDSIEFDVQGWHSFEGDVLTGARTLVCEISPSSRASLSGVQSNLIGHFAPRRNQAASTARYKSHFESLSEDRRRAVLDRGFPFIDDDWIPHLTIASINPSAWATAWSELRKLSPEGSYRFQGIDLYRLDDDHPVLVDTYPLTR
ncbi:MAG TPA: hypothetical protein DDW52_05415 [Planctomycetaceae bacterium]|nr:hypothetical protein [Planctomycetaceae bacterium]